jgi:hypothetical protein
VMLPNFLLRESDVTLNKTVRINQLMMYLKSSKKNLFLKNLLKIY